VGDASERAMDGTRDLSALRMHAATGPRITGAVSARVMVAGGGADRK
jgi:hypothetical protein